MTLYSHTGITRASQVDAQVSEGYGMIVSSWRSAGQMMMANIYCALTVFWALSMYLGVTHLILTNPHHNPKT